LEIKKNKKNLRRDLLNRDIPPSFIEENTEKYSRQFDKEASEKHSYVVFKLGNLWLALDTKYLFQTFDEKYIHTIPHRSDGFLLGLVNVNGNLELAFDLKKIIDVGRGEPIVRRMLEVGNGKLKFVFSTDDIAGIVNVSTDKIEELPDEIARDSFFKARFFEHNTQVMIIDDEAFFRFIEKKLNE